MTVEIGVLGPLRATVDGVAVELGGPARRAVLARLAVAGGEVVTADRLVDDLAGGRPGPNALSSLQVHVSHLRRVLEPRRAPRTPSQVLVTAAPGYALRLPGPDALDATRLGDLVDRARGEPPVRAAALLREALAVRRGPAYAEFAGEAWAQAEAARLDEVVLTARERLAAAELALGRPDDVVPLLEGHVHDHPLREEGVRLLATALHRAGRAPDALELLRRTRGHLREELGLDPGPALVRLESAVLTVPGPAPVVPAATAPPLGRDAELARCEAAAARVAAGAVELVLVAGEAGSGKTTLVDAVADARARAGWTVARGRCPEVDGAPPAWPWTEVLRDLGAAEAGDPTPFARGRAVLDALQHRAPVLVTLDDLHRADDETLRLLRMVASGADAGLLVVGTHRGEEDTAALHATWAALATVVGDRLTLAGLVPDAVGALLARHGLPADTATASAVADRTGGNPLFVREVARLALTTGSSGQDGLPAGVRDVLRRRLRELPGCSRAVLAHVALLGRSAEVDLVLAVEAAVTGRTVAEIEEDVLDGLDAAVAAGVLGEDDGARAVRFVHDLWREVVADEVPRLRRARRHARILDVLEAGVAGPAVAVAPAVLAHHALAAGDRVAAARMLAHVAAAADDAMARGAFRSAVALCRAALALVPDGPSVVPLRCALVTALAASGAGEHAHAERGLAVDAARATGDPELVARALTSLDAPMPWPVRGTGGRMAPLLAELVAGRPDDTMRTRLLLAHAREVEFLEPARAAALADEALRRARASGDTRLLCTALNTVFLVTSQPECWDRIEPVGREMLEAARAGGHADHRAEAHHVLFCAAVVRDDPATARHHADAALAAATDGQLEMTLAFVGLHDAMLALTRGHDDLAERTYAEEGERLAAAGVPHATVLGEVARFTLALARGDTSASLPALRRIDAAFPRYAHDLLAHALLDAGHEHEARALWARRLPVPRDWSWGGLLTVQGLVAARLGDRERAAEAFAALEPFAGRWGLSVTGILAFAPIDLVLARLARTLGHGDDAVAAHRARALAVVGDAGPWRDRVDELLPLDARG
ncbi:BTAD domain-containing putative transcriptional regulator [Actinomycetospora lutea]|uniref:BTAD domain-containing putative transcriptional regulator n=1 Tax=Actinomycetospora lutea TaxID=663604 RepID=UPI00236611B3|nr:BTAD domain-containing putative transcriptional regulator [Actinomycetospora lutea]MDD7938649.1 BTAD domain-containing putative transcriptional regulator [Actinomycetospora lutea]